MGGIGVFSKPPKGGFFSPFPCATAKATPDTESSSPQSGVFCHFTVKYALFPKNQTQKTPKNREKSVDQKTVVIGDGNDPSGPVERKRIFITQTMKDIVMKLKPETCLAWLAVFAMALKVMVAFAEVLAKLIG